MKFKIYILSVAILIFILGTKCFETEAFAYSENPGVEEKHLKSVKDFSKLIEEKAREMEKLADKRLRSREMGIIPKELGYQKHIVDRAKRSRGKELYGSIMNNPIEIYRECIYPRTNANSIKWCKKVYMPDEKKITSCQLSFCNICCSNLEYAILKNVNNCPFASVLNLTSPEGQTIIKDYIAKGNTVAECRNTCSTVYPSNLPKEEITPSRDPTLGKSAENPGHDCQDIKTWGDVEALSGMYFVKFPLKGVVEVFCDMETDGGGWTLFLYYNHEPGQEIFLNGNVIFLFSKFQLQKD